MALKHFRIKPIFKNGRFYNYNQEFKSRVKDYLYMLYSFLHEVYIFLASVKNGKSRFPQNFENWFKPSNVVSSSVEPSFTWIGHATFLIQINEINILTDPIFGPATIFFPRTLPPGISIEKLPRIDYVLISHNHLDHMDSNSLLKLKKLNPNMKVFVPLGDKNWFDKRGFNNVYECFWWESFEFSQIKLTFLPSFHWSQRGIFDQNKSLWGSWMIESKNESIYFAGDTGNSEHFYEIAKFFPKIDIVLMPIGPCEPRQKMCHSHVSAEEAGKAFLDLKAKYFIPMHWGTFHFGTDFFETPILRIKKWWSQNLIKLNSSELHIIKIGERITIKPEITSITEIPSSIRISDTIKEKEKSSI